MSSEASITVGERLQSVYEEITGTYQELQWGDSFVDLEECSPDYQRSYKNAMKVSLSSVILLLQFLTAIFSC